MTEGYTPGQITVGIVGVSVAALATMGLTLGIAVAGPLLAAPGIYAVLR